MARDRIVGIDLGTSNSCIALCTHEKPEIIRNAQGDRTTPSVVAFARDGKVLVGVPAARQAIINPARTVYGVKRLVGQRFDSEVVSTLRPILPYEVARARNGDAWVSVDQRVLSPPEVQSYTLERVRAAAEEFCCAEVRRAVITVPAFFDETQRQAVRDAAEIAGLEAIRLLNEPTAVALAYGSAQVGGRELVVVDFGGGTLDVTVMRVERGRFEALSTSGDILLGGSDVDRALALLLAREIEEQSGVDLTDDAVAIQRLVNEAENAKKQLTSLDSVEISLPFLAQSESGPVNYQRTLLRTELEAVARPIVERMTGPCTRAIESAGIELSDSAEVILAGGMTRMPLVQRRVEAIFGRRPSQRINPDEAIASGAALLSASLEGLLPELEFVDVAPRGIGLRTAGDRYVPLIRQSTPLPAQASREFATTQADQRTLELEVLQGEAEVASKNRRLARILLEKITPGPAGSARIRVTFTVDAQGKLSVRATELQSNAVTAATVSPLSGLGRAEVQRLATERSKASRRAATGRDARRPTDDGVKLELRSPPAAERRPQPAPEAAVERRPQPEAAAEAEPAAKAPSPAAGKNTLVYCAVAIVSLVALALALWLLTR